MNVSEDHIVMRIKEIVQNIAQVEGWLSNEGVDNLYRHAIKAPSSNIVEIGSWKGRSTACLAYAIQDLNEGCVYAVDTWKGSAEHQMMLQGYSEDQLYNEFIDNMTKLNLLQYIKPIKMESVAASFHWPKSLEIGLLYIDASHDYWSVKQDFDHWSPFVASGGYIILDDVPSWEGPTLFSHDISGHYNLLAIRGNHAIFQKPV